MEGDPKERFPCTLCEKVLQSKYGFKYHMKSHSGEKLTTCQQCNYSFISSSQLKQHTKIHTGEKYHMCQLCQKSFAQTSTLTTHMITHTGEKKHNCHQCAKYCILILSIRSNGGQMIALLLILHWIPISTPLSMECNSAVVPKSFKFCDPDRQE